MMCKYINSVCTPHTGGGDGGAARARIDPSLPRCGKQQSKSGREHFLRWTWHRSAERALFEILLKRSFWHLKCFFGDILAFCIRILGFKVERVPRIAKTKIFKIWNLRNSQKKLKLFYLENSKTGFVIFLRFNNCERIKDGILEIWRFENVNIPFLAQ